MKNKYYTYILSNKYNEVLYIGVTNDLIRRVYEHKNKLVKGFTSKYNVDKLVYHEVHNEIQLALRREKELKDWKRDKKIALISTLNKSFKDLYEEI
jgi:putative endonuclease